MSNMRGRPRGIPWSRAMVQGIAFNAPTKEPAKQAAKKPTTPTKKPTKQTAKTPKPVALKPKPTPRETTLVRRKLHPATVVARSILAKKNPKGYGPDKIDLVIAVRQVENKKNWREACEAMGLDPEAVKPPSRDAIARLTGHRVD